MLQHRYFTLHTLCSLISYTSHSLLHIALSVSSLVTVTILTVWSDWLNAAPARGLQFSFVILYLTVLQSTTPFQLLPYYLGRDAANPDCYDDVCLYRYSLRRATQLAE